MVNKIQRNQNKRILKRGSRSSYMAVWLNVPKSSGLIDGTGSELCAGAIPSHRMHLKNIIQIINSFFFFFFFFFFSRVAPVKKKNYKIGNWILMKRENLLLVTLILSAMEVLEWYCCTCSLHLLLSLFLLRHFLFTHWDSEFSISSSTGLLFGRL